MQVESEVSALLELCNLVLVQAVHLCRNVFHKLAILLTHNAEVALHFLHEYALTFHEVEFLHVYFALYEVCHSRNVLTLCVVDGWNHNLCERLAYFDVHLTAQSQYHRGDALCHIHTCFEVEVDGCLVGSRPLVEVNAFFLAAKVVIKFVGIERCERCDELCHCHKAGIECIVSTALVAAHLLSPEAFAVQTHVPVA